MSSIQRKCTIKNCENKYKHSNFCSTHYKRFKKYGDPLKTKQKQESHGMSDTATYRSWTHMKDRCYRPNTRGYENYGERGITVCKRWLNSFVQFYKDLGSKPTPQYSIDRIDGNLHYSCGKCAECISNGWLMNCRWATRTVQNWNQRIRSDNTSTFRGVHRAGSKWAAVISHRENNVSLRVYLGKYHTSEEAAIAYDIACIFFRGDEAKTNIL